MFDFRREKKWEPLGLKTSSSQLPMLQTEVNTVDETAQRINNTFSKTQGTQWSEQVLLCFHEMPGDTIQFILVGRILAGKKKSKNLVDFNWVTM